MLKNKNILIISILLLVILLNIFITTVSAANSTQLQIIERASETKYLENDQGYISKTIVDSNSDTGEVTIELKVSNIAKEQKEDSIYENTEIYIMISENLVNNVDKLNKYLEYIDSFASKVFKQNSNTKIGIIGITGTISDMTYDENGNAIFGSNDEGDVKGTENNSEILVSLTKDLDTINNEIKNMNSSKNDYRCNLQAAIRLANKNYSNKTNKILVSLYDGVPDIAIGVEAKVSYGTLYGTTLEQAVKNKHKNIASYTKNEILTLKSSNVSFILLRPDDTSYDEVWYNMSTGKKELDFDGSPYVQEIYGTMENPTYGKMYEIDENTLSKVVTEDIYKDVMETIQPDLKEVKIVDYFPEDIVKNFDFEYVGNPSVGTVSENIDSKTNTIEWDIGTLKGNETATLKYKLRLKDMNNEELLNKVISTNEKVVLSYNDAEDKSCEVILDSSPKVKLEKITDGQDGKGKEENNINGKTENEANKKDNTLADRTFPNTGKVILIWVIGIIAVSAIGAHIRYKKLYIK